MGLSALALVVRIIVGLPIELALPVTLTALPRLLFSTRLGFRFGCFKSESRSSRCPTNGQTVSRHSSGMLDSYQQEQAIKSTLHRSPEAVLCSALNSS